MFLCSLLLVIQVFSQVIVPDKIPDEIGINVQDSHTVIETESKPSAMEVKAEPIGEVEVKHVKKLLDINIADSTGFLELYGIGPVFSGRIVKYRNLLGGYHECEQLLEVYGMDSIRYDGFCSNIRVDNPDLRRLDINVSSFKDLLRHPYLDYNTVKIIVGYRDKNGPLDSPGKLWADSVLHIGLKKKLLPYLK